MRSGTIYSYNSLSFGTLEDQDDVQRRCKQVEWSIESKGIRKVIVVIGYGTLVLTALNAIAIIAILITLLVKYNSPVDSEFSLYKNTRFKECAAVQPDAANCSAISASYERDSTYSHYADLGRFYIVGSEQASYEWCQMVSCFNEYKVIPSSATDSAIGPTALYGWWSMIATCLTAMWTLKRSSPWFNRKFKSTSCQGILELGVLDWASLIWDIAGPISSWWASFAFSIITPAANPTFSLVAWATTWKYVYTVQLHPYSCILARIPRIRRVLPWAFGLLAASQWGATIYSMQSGNKWDNIYQDYKCLVNQVSNAPGTSTCSAEELCSKDWLFTTANFSMPGNEAEGFPLGFFIILTTFALTPLAVSFLMSLDRREESFKYFFWRMTPIVMVPFGMALSMPMPGITYPIILGIKWSQRHADALVAYDTQCHAVHVALSPWRFYLDVNEYARALRVVRLWFGV